MHFQIDGATIVAVATALGALSLDWIVGIANAVVKGGWTAFSLALLPKQLYTTIAASGMAFSFAGLLQAITTGGVSTALAAFVVTSAGAVSVSALNDVRLKVSSWPTNKQTVSTSQVLLNRPPGA